MAYTGTIKTEVISKVLLKAEGLTEHVNQFYDKTGIRVNPRILMCSFFLAISPVTIQANKVADYELDTLIDEFYNWTLDELAVPNKDIEDIDEHTADLVIAVIGAIMDALRDFGLFVDDRKDQLNLQLHCLDVLEHDNFLLAICLKDNLEDSVLYENLLNTLTPVIKQPLYNR